MKRIVLMCLFLSIITFVHAQVSTEKDPVSITGGVKVESSFSNFIHSGISKGSSKMNPGATVGGFLNLGISRYFSVQGELLFHYKESDFEWSGEKGNYQYWGAEIPVYAMCHWNRRDGSRLYVGIGPYTNFGFKATYRSNGQKLDLYEKMQAADSPPLRIRIPDSGLQEAMNSLAAFRSMQVIKSVCQICWMPMAVRHHFIHNYSV